MKKGRAGTMTHDYKRNGTTTLFAALNMLDGSVIGQCMPRHRHREFLCFLKTIDRQTPVDLDLHLIVDNYATHKTEAVKGWLKRHKRFHLHFTPTSASWLNMVERFFAEITRERIRRGAFTSVAELKEAIMEYLENHNAAPKPFVWTKSADEILKKVARAKQALESKTLALLERLGHEEALPDRRSSCRRRQQARCAEPWRCGLSSLDAIRTMRGSKPGRRAAALYRARAIGVRRNIIADVRAAIKSSAMATRSPTRSSSGSKRYASVRLAPHDGSR